MKTNFALILISALALAACGEDPAEPTAADSAAPATDAKQGAEPEKPGLPRTPSPAGAGVFFINPADGDTVTNPVRVEFGIVGMEVVKAGNNAPDSGHHHLIIDAELPDLGMPVPANENYIHFGDGSTSTVLTLAPGSHTLQMLLGDHLHIPHDPAVKSAPITIIVE
jgi:hypothetical protein